MTSRGEDPFCDLCVKEVDHKPHTLLTKRLEGMLLFVEGMPNSGRADNVIVRKTMTFARSTHEWMQQSRSESEIADCIAIIDAFMTDAVSSAK